MIGRTSFVILGLIIVAGLVGFQMTNSSQTSASQPASNAQRAGSPRNTPSSQTTGSFNGYDFVDKKTGIIRKPDDFRDLYQELGVYTPVDLNNNTEMHYTYATPGTAQYYRKTGKFADGTVLVKETFATDHGQMTTGDVHWATATKVWFIMIKDDKKRYPGNPLWGDGWGWALYKSDAPDKQVATNYKKDCLGCHVPAQSTDWVYIQGYPVLKSSK